MFDIKSISKSIHKLLLDNHIKLMRRISWVIILFAYFTISTGIIVIFTPESSGKASFIALLDSLGGYLWVLFLLLAILPNLFSFNTTFKNNLSNKQILFIKNYFPVLPMFISTIGVSFIFISIISKNILIVGLGENLFLVGLLLGVIMLIIKNYFESHISYAICEANKRINNLDTNEPQQIKQFIRFINLALNNINLQFGKNFKLNSSELGTFQFETILRECLPYYIKTGNTAELDSLKNHIRIMAGSVNENDVINFKIFTNELIELCKEVIKFFEDNNIQIDLHTSILNFFKDLENIKKLAVILFYLIPSVLVLFYWGSGELTSKSLFEFVLRK